VLVTFHSYQESGKRNVADVKADRRKLPTDPDGMFVDLGSDKGAVLLAAAVLPFRRVIGSEIDEGLAGAARRDLERARFRLRAQRRS